MLIEGFEHLNVYLIIVQKISNFFLSLNKAVGIFGNFLRIIHGIISPIPNFYTIWSLQMPKCLSKISPKIPIKLTLGFWGFWIIFGTILT